MTPRPGDLYEVKFDERVSHEKELSEIQNEVWNSERTTFGQGTRKHLQGATFPIKVAHQEIIQINVLYSVDIMKRVFIETIKLFPIPTLRKLVTAFNNLGTKILGNFVQSIWYTNPLPRELRAVIADFLVELKIPRSDADVTGKLIGTLFQYDCAYYLRLEDVMSETTKEKLIANPRKEIKRLVQINQDRDVAGVKDKFAKVANIASFILIIPKYKKAFIKAVKKSKFEKFQYDDEDRFFACLRTDGYKYFGKTQEERRKLLTENGWNPPIDLKNA